MKTRSVCYRFRVVVPRRDYKRIKWIEDVIKSGVASSLYMSVDTLFTERRDLDVIEVAFTVESVEQRRELEARLASSLRGSIGFFVVRKV
ncbi:MAG: hypothetical protein QW291_04010 [Thermofilaceae archaeon]